MQPFLKIHDTPVFVGRDLLERAGSLVPGAGEGGGRVFVMTSAALRERFGARVASSFTPHAEILTITEGEVNKTLDTANEVISQLLQRGARRDSTLVVVGGGMIGDTAGFAASIFLRGINLVHVPTTLLAQVDSSIGGKLAVNHLLGKNLIGSFYPPLAIITDLSVLDSLPPRERLSGLYEALKGGVIADPVLFELFERGDPDIDEVVRRAIRVKAEIVSADEREADLRRLLNYGHTIAHGIEAALHYEGITHGEAVAWGMIGANAIAVDRGLLPAGEAARIQSVILAYNPAPLPPLDRAQVLAATEHDKKNTGNARVMVFPRKVGDCVVLSDVRLEEIERGIDAALQSSSLRAFESSSGL